MRSFLKDFKAGKIPLGKTLSQKCLNAFEKELKNDSKALLAKKKDYIYEILSRPVDPFTKTVLTALLKPETKYGLKKVINKFSHHIQTLEKDLIKTGKELIKNMDTIMIIGYSKVLMNLIKRYGKHLTVYIPQGGPTNSGETMVEQLQNNAILIPDSSMGYFMPSVDAVITRSVCATTEGFLGKAGMGTAAVLASWYQKKFYIFAEYLRFGNNFVVSEFNWKKALPNRAPINDLAHFELVERIVSEEAILKPQDYFKHANKKIQEMIG